MFSNPDLRILENLSENEIQKDLDDIFQFLLIEMKIYLNLESFHQDIKININKDKSSVKLKSKKKIQYNPL